MESAVTNQKIKKLTSIGRSEYPLNTTKLSRADFPIPKPKEPLPAYFADTGRDNPFRTRPTRGHA